MDLKTPNVWLNHWKREWPTASDRTSTLPPLLQQAIELIAERCRPNMCSRCYGNSNGFRMSSPMSPETWSHTVWHKLPRNVAKFPPDHVILEKTREVHRHSHENLQFQTTKTSLVRHSTKTQQDENDAAGVRWLTKVTTRMHHLPDIAAWSRWSTTLTVRKVSGQPSYIAYFVGEQAGLQFDLGQVIIRLSLQILWLIEIYVFDSADCVLLR